MMYGWLGSSVWAALVLLWTAIISSAACAVIVLSPSRLQSPGMSLAGVYSASHIEKTLSDVVSEIGSIGLDVFGGGCKFVVAARIEHAKDVRPSQCIDIVSSEFDNEGWFSHDWITLLAEGWLCERMVWS